MRAILRRLRMHEVRRLNVPCARHVAHDDRRLARDVLAHMPRHEAGVGVQPAAGSRTDDQRYRFAGVKVGHGVALRLRSRQARQARYSGDAEACGGSHCSVTSM